MSPTTPIPIPCAAWFFRVLPVELAASSALPATDQWHAALRALAGAGHTWWQTPHCQAQFLHRSALQPITIRQKFTPIGPTAWSRSAQSAHTGFIAGAVRQAGLTHSAHIILAASLQYQRPDTVTGRAILPLFSQNLQARRRPLYRHRSSHLKSSHLRPASARKQNSLSPTACHNPAVCAPNMHKAGSGSKKQTNQTLAQVAQTNASRDLVNAHPPFRNHGYEGRLSFNPLLVFESHLLRKLTA